MNNHTTHTYDGLFFPIGDLFSPDASYEFISLDDINKGDLFFYGVNSDAVLVRYFIDYKGFSYKSLAKRFNEERLTTSRGSKFYPQTIKRLYEKTKRRPDASFRNWGAYLSFCMVIEEKETRQRPLKRYFRCREIERYDGLTDNNKKNSGNEILLKVRQADANKVVRITHRHLNVSAIMIDDG